MFSMRKGLFFVLFWGLCLVSALRAQTAERPFAHGSLPADWFSQELTNDNGGVFKIGFARIIKAEGDFGFIYEGAKITVEQYKGRFADWQKETYSHLSNTDRFDSQEQCRCTRLHDGKTRVGGYPAHYVSERQKCHKKADGRFDDEDVVRSYYVEVGKIGYFIHTESDSERDGGTDEYERQIDQIIGSFSFFGGSNNGGGGGSNTGGDNDDTGGNTGGDAGDEDISIGDVVIGAVVGGGAAGIIGYGIKKLVTGSKAATNAANNAQNSPQPKPQPNNPKNSNQPKPKNQTPSRNTQPKKKEEEPKEPEDDEKEEKKEEERYMYSLQISKQALQLKAGGESQHVQIVVMRSNSQGVRNVCYDTRIELRPSSAALAVTPLTGAGIVDAAVGLRAGGAEKTMSIDVHAYAANEHLVARISIGSERVEALYEFVHTLLPADKQSLRADGNDVWYLYAQVRNRHNADDPEQAALTAKIRFSAPQPSDGWLNLGEQRLIDGWQAVGFTASHPQPHLLHPSQIVRPPKSIGVQASVVLPDGNSLQRIFDFPLQQPAVLDVDNDKIYFPATPKDSLISIEQKHIDIVAFIEDANEGDKWEFSAAYEKGKPRLTDIEILPRNHSQAIVRLKQPTAKIPDGAVELHGFLLISANCQQRGAASNQRQVSVTLRGEGIYATRGLNKNGILQISGESDDKATKVHFAVFVWDATRQEMIEDPQAAKNIEIDLLAANDGNASALNMLSVAKIQHQYEDIDGSDAAIFSFAVQNDIPGEEKLLPFNIQLKTTSDITRRSYAIDLQAGIFAQGIGANSEDWQREYDNCRRYIERHVPVSHHADMMRMLEERKMSLGHEGLYYLRHRIHSIAQQLILAEGAEGYRAAEKWYTDVIELLEWAQWAGNLAFSAVAATVFGPYAPAVTIAKSYGIQALQYVLEGKTLEQWVYDSFTLHTLFKAAEGRLIDTDRIAEYFKNDGTIKAYAKAWAIFIAYHFAYNVFWEKKSVVEALKQVAREIRDEAIVTFFQRRLKSEGEKGKDGMEPITDPIRKLRQGYVARANGQHDCRLEDVLNCMRDPQAMRTLKKASPELQDAFNRTRERLYSEHDTTVRERLAQELGCKPEDLRIDDFRTPGGAGSNINTDRDYRMLRRAGTDADGNEIWFEVPKEKWQDFSYQTFGQLTGKPPHMSDLEWAQKHLQLATDKYHIEASPDYSDHAINPKTGEKTIIRPNIIGVEEGKSRLIDATALGNMYHEKVHASLRMNQLSEAIAQCKKGVDTLEKVRKGYDMQNLPTGQLPASLQKGMEIVRNAPTDKNATPEAMQKFNDDLKAANFHSLEDFSNKLASQFESLKKYDQQPK